MVLCMSETEVNNKTIDSLLTKRSGSGMLIPLKKVFVENICTCLGSKSPGESKQRNCSVQPLTYT